MNIALYYSVWFLLYYRAVVDVMIILM